MLPAEMRGGRVRVLTQPAARLAVPREDIETLIGAQGRSAKRRMLLRLLADGAVHPVNELKLLVRDPMPALRTLAEEGAVTLLQQEILRRPGGDRQEEPVPAPALTPHQSEVLQAVEPALRQGKGKFLLHGVTGSGKT